MRGGGADHERLRRAPFRLPLPRRAGVLRWSAATALVVLAGLVLLTGSPAPCPPPPRAGTTRPVPPVGTVGVPVTLSTGAAAAVVRAGDRVDVVTAASGVLAADVLVLAVHPAPDGLAGSTALYVAAAVPAARRLAGVAPDTPLAITVRPP